METIFREMILDQAAIETGIDPLELRRRNVITGDDVPHTTVTGATYTRITPWETLEQAADILDYRRVRAEQASARSAGRHLGIGLATFVEPNGIGAGPLGSDQAVIRVTPGGTVDVYMGTGSTGNSLETTIPQIVAEHLGCALDDVVFHQGDTATTPYGHGSGGSRAAVVSGGAARESALVLHAHVLALAAQILECSPADLEMVDSVLAVRGVPSSSITLSDVAAFAYRRPELVPAHLQGLEASVRYNPPDVYTWSNACHACVVEVDPETGAVDILRYVVSEDCGILINPMVVEGQIAGGVAQGIAGALFEDFRYDDDGNPLTSTLADYLIPSAVELPSIECGHIESPSASSGGYKGMGEGGAIGAPAAIANAIADALAPIARDGLTALPLTPERIAMIVRESYLT
jgi:carbon-monoxide dehydrogenase large subunit